MGKKVKVWKLPVGRSKRQRNGRAIRKQQFYSHILFYPSTGLKMAISPCLMLQGQQGVGPRQNQACTTPQSSSYCTISPTRCLTSSFLLGDSTQSCCNRIQDKALHKGHSACKKPWPRSPDFQRGPAFSLHVLSLLPTPTWLWFLQPGQLHPNTARVSLWNADPNTHPGP